MKTITFSLFFLTIIFMMTSINHVKPNLVQFHQAKLIDVYDTEFKEIFESSIFKSERNGSSLTLSFDVNISEFYRRIKTLEAYENTEIFFVVNESVLMLESSNGSNKMRIYQNNEITSIRIFWMDYSGLAIYFPENITNRNSWTKELETVFYDAAISVKMIGYNTTQNESCQDYCGIFFNQSYYFNAKWKDKLGIERDFNISIVNQTLEITYSGKSTVNITLSTYMKDRLRIVQEEKNITLGEYDRCQQFMPNIPSFVERYSYVFGNFSGYQILVVNSSAGDLLFADLDGDCRFESANDYKLIRRNEQILINNSIWTFEGFSGNRCVFRFRVYANDSDNDWNASQTYWFEVK